MPLLRTFFKLCFAALFGTHALAATVTGTLDIQRDASEKRNARSADDIIVWLEPAGGVPLTRVQAAHAQMLQKNKMFRPHILPIEIGTIVDFPNADPIFHNAFSSYDGQLFDIGLYPPGSSRSVHFRRPGVVRVFCNIHPSMSAVILVLNTPYFTQAQHGKYRLTGVPRGAYELHFFDERATGAAADSVTVNIGEEPAIVAPVLHISEAGYVQLPHKNKYGQDYPPNADSYGSGGPPK